MKFEDYTSHCLVMRTSYRRNNLRQLIFLPHPTSFRLPRQYEDVDGHVCPDKANGMYGT